MTRPAATAIRRRRPGRAGPRCAAWWPWLLLPLLLATASTAEAQTRGPAPSRRPDAAALEAARRFLCPHGGRPVPGRRGRCRGGSTGGAWADDPSVRGWDSGLAPATRGQTACPEGTAPVAALARGDATRCLPR